MNTAHSGRSGCLQLPSSWKASAVWSRGGTPGAARYGQGRRASSESLYLASSAGRGKPGRSYESGLSLQHTVKGNDSQLCVKLSKNRDKWKLLLATSITSHPAACPLWEERKEKQSTERSREEWVWRSRWKCLAEPRQGPPELQFQVEESQGEQDTLIDLHLAGGSKGAGKVWSTSESTWRNQGS